MNMPPIVIEATKFVWDRHPTVTWTWPVALGWTHWHLSMGYMAIARDNNVDNTILGVAVIRPVAEPGDGIIAYEHDEDGPCLFIDFFACDDPIAYPLLAEAFARRFGPRESVAYFRGFESALRVKPYERFKRRVSGRLNEEPFLEAE